MAENEQTQEMVERQEQPLAIADGLLNEEAIRRAEMMVDGINKIKAISIKVTGPQDWTVQGGKPYLDAMGCMKIAQLWGVNFKGRAFQPEGGERITDEKGTYILFTVHGRAEFKGRTVEDVGTCSTRDDFFGRAQGKLKALEDVDLENIKKKAVTNLQGRLLKKILGLSFTVEDLQKAGINLEKVSKTEYAGGGAGGGKISEAQANRLFAILMHGSEGDEDKKKRQDELKAHLKATLKIESSKLIERKDYDAVCTKAKAIADASTVGA